MTPRRRQTRPLCILFSMFYMETTEVSSQQHSLCIRAFKKMLIIPKMTSGKLFSQFPHLKRLRTAWNDNDNLRRDARNEEIRCVYSGMTNKCENSTQAEAGGRTNEIQGPNKSGNIF